MAERIDRQDGTDSRGRPLGFQEVMDHIMVDEHSTCICWHIGVINTTRPLSEDSVIKTLKIFASKQEALQMRILPMDPGRRKSKRYKFVTMAEPEKINFGVVILKNKDEWPKHVKTDHDTHKIDTENGPLWRFILGQVENDTARQGIIYEYVFFLKIHHAICDGKSATDALYQQIIPLLCAVENGDDAQNLLPFIPQVTSVEHLVFSDKKEKDPVPWYVKIGFRILRVKSMFFKPTEIPNLIFTNDSVPSETAPLEEPVSVPRIFEKDICGDVIKAAKINGVTVQAVLLVSSAMAFSRTAEAAGVKLPKTIMQAWGINLRRFHEIKTPQPLGDIRAVAFTNHETITDCTVEEFWKSSHRIYSCITRAIDRNRRTRSLWMPKYFIDEFAEGDIQQCVKETGFQPYIYFSNIGNLSAEPEPRMTEGPVKMRLVEKYCHLSSVKVLELIPLYVLVLTYEGRFMWNIIHHPRKISRTFVDKFYENIAEVFKSYLVPVQIN